MELPGAGASFVLSPHEALESATMIILLWICNHEPFN